MERLLPIIEQFNKDHAPTNTANQQIKASLQEYAGNRLLITIHSRRPATYVSRFVPDTATEQEVNAKLDLMMTRLVQCQVQMLYHDARDNDARVNQLAGRVNCVVS